MFQTAVVYLPWWYRKLPKSAPARCGAVHDASDGRNTGSFSGIWRKWHAKGTRLLCGPARCSTSTAKLVQLWSRGSVQLLYLTAHSNWRRGLRLASPPTAVISGRRSSYLRWSSIESCRRWHDSRSAQHHRALRRVDTACCPCSHPCLPASVRPCLVDGKSKVTQGLQLPGRADLGKAPTDRAAG